MPNGESSKEFSPLQIFQELRLEFPGVDSEQRKLQTKNQTKGKTPHK